MLTSPLFLHHSYVATDFFLWKLITNPHSNIALAGLIAFCTSYSEDIHTNGSPEHTFLNSLRSEC